MVRHYKPKTDRGKADGSLMRRAVQEVEKGFSIRQVALDLKIDRITLSRYVKKCQSGQASSNDELVPHFNTRQIFTEEEERGLEEYILTSSVMFHGLGYVAIRRLGFEYAERKQKNVSESWRHNAMAGKDWMSGFMKRHPNISLRSPEATSITRAQGFNKKAVGAFFELWTKTQAEKNFGPESIFNLDETGITTVHNISKLGLLAASGMKQVGQITALERGTVVTVCCCVNAIGKALPPVMIFPRVHFKDHMIKGAPPGTLGLATQSGWIIGELFPQVLEHFIKHIGCSIEKPAVLFMDNHESHLGIDVIDIAREKGLSIITFPSHTSHKLQPLDVTVYGPLKTHYKKAVIEWNLSHPGIRITIYDLPECFARVFYRVLSFENITDGFQKTGIWPLNSEVFSEDDFLAASDFLNNRTNEADGAPTNNGVTTGEDVNGTARMTEHDQLGTSTSAVNTSFEELKGLRQLSKRKAADHSSKSLAKRAFVRCKPITSTAEKQKAEKKLKQKIHDQGRK
uniref:uncharacterized protein n=1 Tax=Myxine glutinosa TaxID=7769 RepID=UPI00358F367E